VLSVVAPSRTRRIPARGCVCVCACQHGVEESWREGEVGGGRDLN